MVLLRSVTPLVLALVALISPLAAAQECIVQEASIALTSCLGTNALSCLACGDALLGWPSLAGECDDIGSICALANCCTACESEAIDYAVCALQDECDKTCDNVAPSPTPPLFPPSFTAPTAGDDDDVSPECVAVSAIVQGCILTNILECGPSCASQGQNDDTLIDDCSAIPDACDQLTCCAPCIEAAKTFVGCEANARGCSENCNDLQPAAPSPVAPFTFPSSPVAPAAPGPCDDLSQLYAGCILENILECAFGACASLPDSEGVVDICGDEKELFCAPLTCCPTCADAGNAVATCAFEAVGCTEATCGDFSPIASIAPFSLPPVAPSAPVTIAPVTVAPVTTAPITTAPITTDTTAPITTAPITTAPITTAPIVPVTNAPVTGPPITKAPTSSAPVMSPVTPAPDTPAPVATSVPETPSPVTPAPTVPDSGASRNIGIAAIVGAIVAVLCM